ncbi:protein phosphatase 1 regulatory subunit 32 isoform X3 [Prionailurus bengalensis]|uniref:protein phosphatase 1 regulatory subunit 32 isoform X3 n=1 Tax=Prionailurus bengalensis TaxID=37029 RepID=UPI001CA98ACC|nr:protein phosphatase 1 regulatory subunit 32 isoform X3 [Prionailurus bengalensis]
MMGKLPLGVVSPYVKMSSGGCTDPLKFYATTYCTAYGQEEFRPRMGGHEGTGYKSNYRPVASYQANLDALDNPAMGHGPYNPFSPPAPLSLSSQGHRSSSDPLEQVRPNFQSVTSQSYRPLEVPDGTYPLPWNMHQTSSGYSQEKPSAATPTKEGPRFLTSEYNSKYLKETSNQPDLLQKISIGSKEETGFTEESTKNPIGFQPPSQTVLGDPVLHPGRSVTRSDFLPMTHIRGDEFLPVLARGSERETGYSRVNERLLNPRVPPPSPRPSSVSHGQFQPPQRVQQTNVALLGRETVGNKEPTGFTLNNPSYIRSPYDPDMDNQYLTTYNQGYFENIPKGLDREGWTRGGTQPQKPGGYALNQPVTRMEATPTPTESLRRLHPHVGRTLIAEDPFYRAVPPSSHFATSS